jgi:hypothetical protein
MPPNDMDLEKPIWTPLREKWYSNTFILFEIVKNLQYKETVFLEKKPKELERRARVIRCLNGWTLDLLKSDFQYFRFIPCPYLNIYGSLMSFKGMPLFSPNPSTRSVQYKEWTDGRYIDKAIGYDFALDLDGETIKQAHDDAKKVKSIFDRFELPYSLRFSGSKGFHFVIENKYLPIMSMNTKIELLNTLTLRIKNIENIPAIDDSIVDDRRVLKTPYSFDRGNICLPLDDYQFGNFHVGMVEASNVLETIKLKNRGTLVRNLSIPCTKAINHFGELIKEYIPPEPKQSKKVK